jgi:adenosylhomocysteine nucleosidase
MSPADKVAVVAALEQEIAPLVSGWKRRELPLDGRNVVVHEREDAVAVAGGIGPHYARRSAELLFEIYRPAVFISTGFAGGLSSDHHIGDVLIASAVIDALHGTNYPSIGRGGIVVSTPGIAGADEKLALREQYGADAVDLEAAAIAAFAQEHGLKFLAVKAISDEVSDTLPPFARFIRDGRFDQRAFTRHAAIRPWMWPRMIRIATEATYAAKQLCAELQHLLAERDFRPHTTRAMRAGRK